MFIQLLKKNNKLITKLISFRHVHFSSLLLLFSKIAGEKPSQMSMNSLFYVVLNVVDKPIGYKFCDNVIILDSQIG